MYFREKVLNEMYPRVSDYMRYELPQLRGTRRRRGGRMPIWDAFVIACGAEESKNGRSLENRATRTARAALNPGGGPCVTVTEANKRRGKKSNGFYYNGAIHIDDEVMAGCEYLIQKYYRLYHNQGRRAKCFLESLLLHESIHWARYRIGLSGDRHEIPDQFNDLGRGSHRTYEPGKFFEKVAYGQDLDREFVTPDSSFTRLARRARKALGVTNVRRRDHRRRSKRGIPQWR